MRNISPLLQTDYYKTGHAPMYPEGTVKVYSNLTPRRSRITGIHAIVVAGIQYWVMEYLLNQWNRNFFMIEQREYIKKFITLADQPKALAALRDEVLGNYKRMMDNTLGKDSVGTEIIGKLWDLGYLPLHIKALPEGSLCPIGVPCLTITNTVDHAYWLVNYLETIMSTSLWQIMTSATIAHDYKKLCLEWAKKTGGDVAFVSWQCHDFSMRGMSSLESACLSGSGHLLSFTGTDTIPAIAFLERYYGANVEEELVGASVPATEHAVMCMGGKDGELETFRRLINQYTSGIVSIVSDTWDLWCVLGVYLPACKAEILAHNRKVVIRPDSGDPVKILTGYTDEEIEIPQIQKAEAAYKVKATGEYIGYLEKKGVIECLYDIFGGSKNDAGYIVLDPHIGAIYGDSITIDRAKSILERMAAKGFASTCVVFGVGSYTYQYNTRDTFGFAVKATYGEVLENTVPVGRELFKDPITDDGTKRSAKGLLMVANTSVAGGNSTYTLIDQATPEMEQKGALETVFLDGKLVRVHTLAEIRERLNKQL